VNDVTWAQEVRRAQPFNEPPVPRALPVDEATRCLTTDPRRQSNRLITATGLRQRALRAQDVRPRDPGVRKYLSDYGGASGRANAYFGLGESYRLLGKNGSARTNFQKLLDDFGDSEFAGPAAYALAVLAFSQRISLPLNRSSQSGRKIEGRLGCVIGQIFRGAMPGKQQTRG